MIIITLDCRYDLITFVCLLWMLPNKEKFLMGQTQSLLHLFSFFSQCKDKCEYVAINDKSIDGGLGTRTRGARMEGAYESSELCWHPKQVKFVRIFGSCCGSVGRAYASDTRGPRFESSHRQTCIIGHLFLYCQLY